MRVPSAPLLLIASRMIAWPAVAHPQDDDPLKPYVTSYGHTVGAYELSPGHRIVVVIAFGGMPEYIDLATGRFGKLYPSASAGAWMTDSLDTAVNFELDSAGS